MSRLVVVAWLAMAGTAAACLNDRESPQAEREFRSDYGDPPPAPATPARATNPALTQTGAALLVAAVALAARRPRVGG